MTNQEIQSCKVETIDELAELRRLRVCLRARAESYLRQFDAASRVVGNVIGKSSSSGGAPEERSWPSYSDILDVTKKARDTDSRIRELQDRLRQWGVID